MLKKKNITRILSICLTLTLVLTTLGIGLPETTAINPEDKIAPDLAEQVVRQVSQQLLTQL